MSISEAMRADGGRHPSLTYRLPPTLRRIKWTVRAGAAAVAIVGLYAAFWFGAALLLRMGALNWIEERRAEGFTAAFQTMEIGGFPFRLTLRLDHPTFADSAAPLPWAWEGERILAEARPWSPMTVHADFGARHGILLGKDADTRAYALTTTRTTLDIVLALGGGWPETARAEMTDAHLSGPGLVPIAARSVGAGLAYLDPDSDRPDAPFLDISADVRGLGLPTRAELPLGRTIESLDLAATVLGTPPPPPWRPALAAWRDAGGKVQVRTLELHYGPLTVWAGGTLALDAQLQPIGTATAKATGFVETIDTLRATGIIRPRDAVTAMLVLGALSKSDPAGGPSTLNLPLVLRDRRVYAGPAALAEIPPIVWD